MFATYLPRPLWGAFAVNSAVVTAATFLLAVSPATVSFPIAVAEGVVLVCGLAAMLGVNLAVLGRVFGSAPDVVPRRAGSPAGATDGPAHAAARVGVDRADARRLLVCWADPPHRSADGAEEWATTELRRALAAERVRVARLARLRRASLRYGTSSDWLLEIDVAPGHDERTWLESPAWDAWLGDLRALGMRPQAMVAERGRVLRDGVG